MRGLLQLVVVLVTLDMRPLEALRLYGMVALSAAAHVLAAIVLLIIPAVPLFAEPHVVTIDVIEPPPEDPIEELVEEVPDEDIAAPEPPEPAPPPEPVVERPRPEPRPEPPRAPEPPPEPAPEPPAQEEAIADFSGVTLTNPGGASWQATIGNGEAIEGPLGQPNARVTGRRRQGTPEGTPGGRGDEEGAPIVAAADLSRQPGPPGERLVRLLEDNYPREARQLGLEGHADVRIHVHADGRVRPLAVVRETQEGFGDACRRTLRLGGTWSPPLDRQGRPVDTVTIFRCTFSIRF